MIPMMAFSALLAYTHLCTDLAFAAAAFRPLQTASITSYAILTHNEMVVLGAQLYRYLCVGSKSISYSSDSYSLMA